MATVSKNLRTRLKEATAQEILASAEAELAEHGLAATSMNSIARRAGVAVGTLYNYYKDKDILLSTLLSERRRLFGEIIDEAIATSSDLPFEDQLTVVLKAMFEVFENHRNFLRLALENEKPFNVVRGKGKDQVKSPARQFIDRLRPVMEKGLKSGVLREEDAELYAAALAALARAVMIELLPNKQRSFQSAVPFVLRLFLEGAGK